MGEPERKSPEETRKRVLSGAALLVCAYDDDEKFKGNQLKGAISFVDYLKPLDYPDLYELGGESVDGLKGKFYDLDAVIPPGGRTSALLIFAPLSQDARKAVIEVREYYVGTETITFSLPFQLKATPY